MPYKIPHVRSLEDTPPRMLIGHRVLPENNPVRRFEEHKRLVYARDYAYMCLVGFIPAVEPGGRRPDSRLPPAPLPPGSRAREVSQKPLPPAPPAPPAGSGPSSPRSPKDILRHDSAAGNPARKVKGPVVPVTDGPSDAAWKRVFGRIPPRVLNTIPESINNIKMVPHVSNEEDLCLVPLGSENAVPTTRGIIEDYYEEKEYEQTEQTSLKEKRTPVYLSPKLAQYTAEAIRKSNLNHSARLPPKAKQLLGSPQPTHDNSDWKQVHHVDYVEQSPLHSKGSTTNSLRHSASLRVASLLTPTKARKTPSSSLAHDKVINHTSSSSQHTTFLHKHTTTSSVSSSLKHSTTVSPFSHRNKMSAQSSPTKQAVAGAAFNKSISESAKSPVKSTVSPKKEDFSLKRAISNAFTPKREDMPPPLPKKDTPPPVVDEPEHLRMSSTIVDVRGASGAYSGNAFAAAVTANESRETITVAFGHDSSPIKEVKSGVVKLTHAPHSPFVGQKATFDADPKLVEQIQEEFNSPPMDHAFFHGSQVRKQSPLSAERAKTPRYIAGGLLEGGLLPATTYQPPAQISSKIRPKTEIYSPSLYSVATGHDVFSTSAYGVAAQELEATPVVPSNSPANDGEQTNGALPVEPVKYIGTVQDNDYVYHPEDHVFNRHRMETPVLTHDFATAGAQQKHIPSNKGPANVDTPANKSNGYGSLDYEHPSAVPRPLRHMSGTGSRSSSSGGLSLRERYFENDGLGINLSNGSTYSINDNGTTLAVDGDDYAERCREMSSLRSPEVYDKEAGFRSLSSYKPRSKDQKYRSQPVDSSKDMMTGSTSRHQAEMHNKLDLMGGKIERLVAVHSRNEGILTSTQETARRILAKDTKNHDTMHAVASNQHTLSIAVEAALGESRFYHESVAAEHREIRASIADLAEHSVDNEKFDLLVDKVVERLLPSVMRGIEKNDANTERILARLDKVLERKQKNAAGPQTRVASSTTKKNFSPMPGVVYSPSAVGPFASNDNAFFAPAGTDSGPAGTKSGKGGLKYTEDPSER
ncbi:hypothetical protein E4T44_06944 [Aureobasidium sp. EXF-8845]|nr:hypothetical protein E4T44_06944 [Aureobasidium sp. EXF-8845]KAI4847110.1 hypothetical protein E4T45_06933 [Aureobasidium sp. EXF-8846]